MISNNKGFTLIELMIAIAVFSILVAGIVNAKLSQQNQSITQQQAIELQQTARAVLYLMTREISSAGFNPNFQPFDCGVTVGGDGTNGPLTFTSITDAIGTRRTVSYVLADPDGDGDNDITVNINNAGALLLAQNIQALTFTYFSNTGAAIAAPVSAINLKTIRSIRISVTVGLDNNELARAANNSTRTLTTTVALRNIDT